MTGRRILPLGHYLGPWHRAPGAPAQCHRVRVGREPRRLFSDEQFLAWVFAHGIPEELDADPWTRASVQERGRQATGLELSEAVDDLLAEGLLVEVGPEEADAAAFAAAHRLRGLKLGLGEDPAAPDGVLLGVPGQPAVAVSRFGYDVWLWGQRTPTLWSACERIAQARAAEVLPELIETLHPLLATAVAYLDVAEDPDSGDAAY